MSVNSISILNIFLSIKNEYMYKNRKNGHGKLSHLLNDKYLKKKNVTTEHTSFQSFR